MEKVVVLSATNRKNSNTLKVAKIYEKILKNKGVDVRLLDFVILPENITSGETFGSRSEYYAKLISEFVSQNNKFIFVCPEYNGSFPGILKTFLDSMSPREWADKSACIVGVSDGRAGNLRGMDHLTSILQYLKMHVFYNKLPISLISKIIDSEGNFLDENQMKTCVAQVDGFLDF